MEEEIIINLELELDDKSDEGFYHVWGVHVSGGTGVVF